MHVCIHLLGFKGKVQVTKDDCQYDCKDDGSCSTTKLRAEGLKPLKGYTLGSCFPQAFGGSCSGIPENCEACNKVIDCQRRTGNGLVGQGNCKYDCKRKDVSEVETCMEYFLSRKKLWTFEFFVSCPDSQTTITDKNIVDKS